jgi:type VI secretion system protein ImpK
VETIRHRLYTMVAASRDPVARELSPHWQGVGAGKFKMLRSIPVWVSASVLGLVLFAQYAWFKYDLLTDASEVQKNIQALAKIKPPATLKPQGVNLTQLLQGEIAQGSVQVDENAQGARVIFKGDGMFTPALDKLSQPTTLLLNKVGEALAQVGGQVRVIGHTDDLPVSGTGFADNQDLSEKRAHSVAQVLMAKGVVTTRLQVMGMGDKQPVATNTSPQGRALNRRVEIEVLPQDGAAPAKTAGASEAPSPSSPPAPGPARSK